ncbi:ANTAR domain-containing protein [Arthrobacter sp. B6]|uniref:ANTAR domain-containing protein n=1 Tax=Arthrobacter sp. B6 TaxID=1570137 RepID=UPI0009EDE8B9|nr:ANTAR domain-containing protein [Arthrobacter sp. B6]
MTHGQAHTEYRSEELAVLTDWLGDGPDLLFDLVAPTETAALQTLAEAGATALTSAAGADIDCVVTLRAPKRNPVTAGTLEEAVSLTKWDQEHSHGPASASLDSSVAILLKPESRDPRWPEYRRRLQAAGYGSAVSLPLRVEHGYAGALTFLAAEANVFTDELMAPAIGFRDLASRSLRLATQLRRASEFTDQLRSALSSRTTIDIACGVIMGQNRCSYDDAFAILAKASSHRNIKLRLIAEAILEGYGGAPETHFED